MGAFEIFVVVVVYNLDTLTHLIKSSVSRANSFVRLRSKILQKRLQNGFIETVDENQSGFIPGRSCRLLVYYSTLFKNLKTLLLSPRRVLRGLQ